MATEVLDFISSQTGVANIQSDETEEYLSVSGTDLVLSKTAEEIDVRVVNFNLNATGVSFSSGFSRIRTPV